MSSEQASAGNNTASMQTSSPLTQHAQMLPATAAPQNGHHGHQDNDDMVGTNAAMLCFGTYQPDVHITAKAMADCAS